MKQIITKSEYELIRDRNCLFILLYKPQNAISLNTNLAKKLNEVSARLRSLKIEKLLIQQIEELHDNPVICDIDVLFNPAYKVDLLSLLTLVAKQKNFTLVWPGRLVDGKLIYGEEQYTDFKTFEVNNYNIVCVI